jgi:hypothetical protein
MRPLKSLVLCFVVATCLQAQKAENAAPADQAVQTFRLDPHWPFVYLKFDHIGEGVRMNDQEPSKRIWLHLVNNCRLPIVVPGGQEVPGGLKGEVSIDGVVRPNPPLNGVVSFSTRIEPDISPIATTPTETGQRPNQKSPAKPKTQSKPTGDGEAPMPLGYPSPDVVSTETIMPGADVLFSIPVNFVTKNWHFEIDFSLDSEVAGEGIPEHSFFVNQSVRGEIEIALSYGFWDIPEEHQAEIEKLNQDLAKKQ